MRKIYSRLIIVLIVIMICAGLQVFNVSSSTNIMQNDIISRPGNFYEAYAKANQVEPVTLTILRVDDYCDTEVAEDFYAEVYIDGEWYSSEDDAGDDDNHIMPNWEFINPEVDSNETELLITIRMMEMDFAVWPIWPDFDDIVDIHPEEDKFGLTIRFNVSSGEWVVDVGEEGIDDDGPYGRDGVWRGTGTDGGVDCAEVEFSISSRYAGDHDRDGLLDEWEEFGYDADGDGTVDVDLPAMGADPNHKDIFVEVDWMWQAGNHSHEPWQAAWIPIYHAFNDSPVENPDDENGIKLHVDTGSLYSGGHWGPIDCDRDGIDTIGDMDCDGDGIIDIGNLGLLGEGTSGGGNFIPEVQFLDFLGDGSVNDFYNVKAANFNPARRQIFHYAVFGHSLNAIDNFSGRAEIFGNDFLVTLGTRANGGNSPLTGLPIRGLVRQHAGTFMHELGHNLNLRHGGGDNDNRKPNYLSVMNYDHQMNGVLGLAVNSGLDYSPRALSTNLDGQLDETNLDECVALNDPRPFVAAMWTAGGNPAIRSWIAFGPLSIIDWNWDNLVNPGLADDGINCGSPPNIDVDLNSRDPFSLPALKVLEGHDDWQGGDLRLDFRHSREFTDGVPLEMVEELDLLDELEIDAARPDVLELTSSTQFCPNATLVNFDNFPPGTIVTNQYPGIHFIDSASVDPMIRNTEQREALTITPPNSLFGLPQPGPSSFNIPLTMAFDHPMYRVGMYIGNGGTLWPFATMRAYDENGVLIGEVGDRVPESVTEFLGIYALEGGIRFIRLNYPISDPEEIDNVIFDSCESIPIPPVVSTEPFEFTVRAEYYSRIMEDNENAQIVILPLEGAPVEVDGIGQLTPFTDTIERNGQLTLMASQWLVAPDGRLLLFSHWRIDEFMRYPDGWDLISSEVDHNTSYTAVYRQPYSSYMPLVTK